MELASRSRSFPLSFTSTPTALSRVKTDNLARICTGDKDSNLDNKQKRIRGVILSDKGWQKLQQAKTEAEYREKQGNSFTLEYLSERTGLVEDTLMKVFAREENVDKKTLRSCFIAFDLTLQSQDYYQPLARISTETPNSLNGQVPLNSRFYVKRSPIESECYQALKQPGSLIKIKSAHGMGKTSLMNRILFHGQQLGYHTVALSLELADQHLFQDSGQFLQWFCAYISSQLQLNNQVEDYWDHVLGNRVSCKRYFEEYLLPQLEQPLVIAIDEVDRIFEYPELVRDFFAMVKIFYEAAKNHPGFQKLRFFILYSTDIYLPLDLNQSPFNIGLSVELPQFNCEQITYLAKQYALNWSPQKSEQLLKWVGGNPYLVQIALYNIYNKATTLEQILSDKITSETYIYKEHLQQQLWYVKSHNFGLTKAFTEVIQAQEPPKIEIRKALQLQGLGLINYRHNLAYLSCELYAQYFREQFNISIKEPQ